MANDGRWPNFTPEDLEYLDKWCDVMRPFYEVDMTDKEIKRLAAETLDSVGVEHCLGANND